MTNNWLLSVENLEKHYGRQQVLSVRELKLNVGDRVVVAGTNGTGKSTLLRIVAGITSFKIGTLHRAQVWPSAPVGYLPQEGGIYRDLTIHENHQTFCRLIGECGPDRTQAIADTLGISSFIGKKVSDLSGGHRRLASLYCFLASGARILILDEPFSALDFHKVAAVRDSLKLVAPDLLLLIISEHLDSNKTIDNAAWNRVIDLEGVQKK